MGHAHLSGDAGPLLSSPAGLGVRPFAGVHFRPAEKLASGAERQSRWLRPQRLNKRGPTEDQESPTSRMKLTAVTRWARSPR